MPSIRGRLEGSRLEGARPHFPLLPPRRAAGVGSARDGVERAGRPPRHFSLERWALRRLGRVDHERRVSAVAASLFELTRPLHRMGDADLHLLQSGALVHDVGRSVDKKTHPEQGARMVLDDPFLPLSPPERRALAYLTLYHKGPVPPAGRDAILWRSDDARRLRLVLGLLRAADALDSRSLESPRLVFSLACRASRAPVLRVTCYLTDDSAKARRTYRRRKKFRLLEEALGCRVEVEVAGAGALAGVA